MPQIQKGTTYTSSGSGSQVTHTNLNAHVDNASLLAGSIDDQTYNYASSNSDSILITKSGVLYKQTKADFTKLLTTQTIDAGSGNDVLVNTYDGATLTGKNYTSANGLTNTVSSIAHGLIAGQLVLISAANDSNYNGVYRITSATTDAFVYTLNYKEGSGSFVSSGGTTVTVTTDSAHGFTNNQIVEISSVNAPYAGTFTILYVNATTFTYSLPASTGATSGRLTYVANGAVSGFGTLSYTKLATQKTVGSEIVTGYSYTDGNKTINGSLEVSGYVNLKTTDALRLPVGTTAQRPTNPIIGQTRFNKTLGLTETYDGKSWTAAFSGTTTNIVSGTNDFTGGIKVDGTTGFMLYEIFQGNISNPNWTSPVMTKPAGEIWYVDVLQNLTKGGQQYISGTFSLNFGVGSTNYVTTSISYPSSGLDIASASTSFFIGGNDKFTNSSIFGSISYYSGPSVNCIYFCRYTIQKFKTATGNLVGKTTALNYTNNGTSATVTSAAHGIAAGSYVNVFASNSSISGRYAITATTVDTFTYANTTAAGSGTCSYFA